MRLRLLALAGLPLCLSFAAQAAPRVTVPADAVTSFAISISGDITPACSLAADAGNSDFGVISDPNTGRAIGQTFALPFSMKCNTPYEASLASLNGGMTYQGQAEPAFSSVVEYQASLDMGAIAGGVALECDSATMRATSADERPRCRARSRRDVAVAEGDGAVRVQLKPTPLPLQMGRYSDSIVVRLAPRVSG